ncbi:MAG: peptidylprolyl isomerase [Bdellovibrionales bacterium]|nr:peptidylprolyl isomerase [Bdellovibrionales bacterium]
MKAKNSKLLFWGSLLGIALLAGATAYMLWPGTRPSEQIEALVEATHKEASGMVIETEHGSIEIGFYPEEAPKTVERIKELVSQGFYNGLSFHRVEPGFVVQGGDPRGNGTGGSGKKLPAEFNAHKHVEGTVAMARAGHDPNSADSQFYICLGTFPHLDGSYTVFGHVVSGMEAVRAIRPGDKMVSVKLR